MRELTRQTLALGHHSDGPRLRAAEAEVRRLRLGLAFLSRAAWALSPEAVKAECERLLDGENANREGATNG